MLGQAAAVLFAATIAASSAWAGAPLADFKGGSRVLIVSSPAATDPSLVKQTSGRGPMDRACESETWW